MASHDPFVVINHDPKVRAEILDASRNLSNQSRIVDARIHRIERQIRERKADAREVASGHSGWCCFGVLGFP